MITGSDVWKPSFFRFCLARQLKCTTGDFLFLRRLEYSYPSIVQTPDGWVHVTHTWSQWPCRRSAIRYHRISEEWAKGRWGWGSTR